MKFAPLIACFLLASQTSLAVTRQDDSDRHALHALQIAEPVNAMCPIGKEPILKSAGTVAYKGKTIGLCCPGCGEAFLAWDESRKDNFVALALAGREPGMEHQGQREDKPLTGETDTKIVEQQLLHYPVQTCIVTDAKLGADAVNHVHNNRLVRLAGADALATFNADPKKYLDALDRKIIEAQLPIYPMASCPVGGPLGSMGEPVNFIFMNRLIRLCCAACEKSIVDEPAKFMAKLDAAYAERQRAAYALESCVVSGSPLGSMGEPVEIVAGTRLVRLCCDGCLPALRKNPGEYLAKVSK